MCTLPALQGEVPKPPAEEEQAFRQIQMARKYLQDQAMKQQQQRQQKQQQQLVSCAGAPCLHVCLHIYMPYISCLRVAQFMFYRHKCVLGPVDGLGCCA